MADGNIPPDVSEAYQTGNARTAAFQTTGVYEQKGVVPPNAGQGDAYTVVHSAQKLDEAGMNSLMDRLQAATAGTPTESTGVIAQISQGAPREPGGASFELTSGSRGDSQVFVVKIGAGHSVSLIDPLDNLPPDRPFHMDDFGAQGAPGANNIARERIDLKPGEKAVVLVSSDGVTEAFTGKGNHKAELQRDMEAYAKANPDSQDWSKFLTERAAARFINRDTSAPGDNITTVSTVLDAQTDLKGQSVTMAVFDQVGHSENDLSAKLARSLEAELPGAVKPKPVLHEELPHIATRPEDLARAANPAMSDPAKPISDTVAPAASKFAGVHAKAAGVTGKAGIALDLAEGDYGRAALDSGQQAALNPGLVKTAAGLVEESAPVAARALGAFAKRLPVIGAVVTTGYVAYETGSDLAHGEWGRAGAAATAGLAEIGGNVVGFGVGDIARETVREGVVLTAGDRYAPDKSGIRQLGERAYTLGEKLLDGAPADAGALAAQQAGLVDNDPLLPKTVKLGGQQTALSAALRDPGFATEFRAALVRADGRDGIDLSAQLKAVDAFARLEDQRRSLPAAATEVASARPSVKPAPGSANS